MFEIEFPKRGLKYTEAEIACVVDFLRSDKGLTQGEQQALFEAKFREKFGLGNCLALCNAASGFHLISDLLGLGEDDEVVCPAHTYAASAYPFLKYGARVVFADIDPIKRVATAEYLLKAVTAKTRVIVAVHLYGYVIDLTEVRRVCDERGILLVEDCAQAIGGKRFGKYAGTVGDFSIFSFQSQKNISTLGEGGMLSVDERQKDKFESLKLARHNGHVPFEEKEAYWLPAMVNLVAPEDGKRIIMPQNYCLTEIQCLVGLLTLERVDELSKLRREKAIRVIEDFSDPEAIRFHKVNSEAHVYHLLVGEVMQKDARDGCIDWLNKQGIQPVIQYYPLYKYPLFQQYGADQIELPNTEAFYSAMISMPFSAAMKDAQLEVIGEAIRDVSSWLKG